jgi:DNA repair protein SbcD/Mre11
MEELLRNERSNDLIKVVFTDETRLIDPMKQLREVFPNACSLMYASDEALAGQKDMPQGPAKLGDPLEVVRSFVEVVRGEGVREDELALVTSGLHDLKNAEVLV